MIARTRRNAADKESMNEYYTLESLLTFGGAVAVITLVPSVVGYLLGEKAQPYLKWVALAFAFGLSLLGAYVAGGAEWTKWIVAAVNGLVLFMAAVGANQLTAVHPTPRTTGGFEASYTEPPKRTMRHSWL